MQKHYLIKKIAKFYLSLAQSEEKHHRLFLDQATNFFDDTTIKTRLHEWLAIESDIIDLLPTLPRLH
ncbi:MAG: tRNA isopentenyl-2-thiomethyl-A-37 hydroxylase MiaE [Candidatus Azotimanducaceae bacterium]